MCYQVCRMMHIKERLLLIGKSIPCGGSGIPLSLSEWSFTICLMPYNPKSNVLCASLNKTFSSFIPSGKWTRNGCLVISVEADSVKLENMYRGKIALNL